MNSEDKKEIEEVKRSIDLIAESLAELMQPPANRPTELPSLIDTSLFSVGIELSGLLNYRIRATSRQEAERIAIQQYEQWPDNFERVDFKINLVTVTKG